MWYLIDVDDGVIDKSFTKHELMIRNGYSHANKIRDGYSVTDSNGRDQYIFNGAENAISQGFSHFFIDVSFRISNLMWYADNCKNCKLGNDKSKHCPYHIVHNKSNRYVEIDCCMKE